MQKDIAQNPFTLSFKRIPLVPFPSITDIFEQSIEHILGLTSLKENIIKL